MAHVGDHGVRGLLLQGCEYEGPAYAVDQDVVGSDVNGHALGEREHRRLGDLVGGEPIDHHGVGADGGVVDDASSACWAHVRDDGPGEPDDAVEV